jgi:hypothetical protein
MRRSAACRLSSARFTRDSFTRTVSSPRSTAKYASFADSATAKRCSTRPASALAVCADVRLRSAPRRPAVKSVTELLSPAL